MSNEPAIIEESIYITILDSYSKLQNFEMRTGQLGIRSPMLAVCREQVLNKCEFIPRNNDPKLPPDIV